LATAPAGLPSQNLLKGKKEMAIQSVPVNTKPIDVEKAKQRIREFGYTAGYLQTATFIVGEPATKEIPRQVVVSVYELERLGAAENLEKFKQLLDTIAVSPIDKAYPRVTLPASA
jgi:hypothetical protein